MEVLMPLDLQDFQEGVQEYWREIGRRSIAAQKREHAFVELAGRFSGRKPPSLTREDLTLIMEWKHTDARWRDRALKGLAEVTDDRLRSLTSPIAAHDLDYLLPWMRGAIKGVAVASISAVLTAASPDRFCVIDEFSLRAINSYYRVPWLRFSKDGKFVLDEKTYTAYVRFCRERASELTASSGQRWTARQVEMAFWAIGKGLGPAHACN